MCGIAGYYSFSDSQSPSKECLSEAVDLVAHRGPDDKGIWLNHMVGLGSRRLAIQDLTHAGRQPMQSPDGRYIIVFNGEIYNFKELKRDLENKGERFKTNTDTEVLLRLFMLMGSKCLSKLNGMFAFSVFDTKKERLFLARDRFSIKPLYIFNTPKIIFFASELKSLLPFVKELDLSWELNNSALYEYFLFRYNAGSTTLIKDVTRCEPGSWMVIGKKGIEKREVYYDMRTIISNNSNSEIRTEQPIEYYTEQIREALKESIRLRMISDAPVGVALSGGVDSSLVTGLMRELHPGKIRTYSIVFNGNKNKPSTNDESVYSDYIANRYHTEHCKILLEQKIYCDSFLKCVWHNDEPLFDPQTMAMHALFLHASRDVKVLLGGEGGDEIFAGYEYPRHICYYKHGERLNALKHRYAKVSDVNKFARLSNKNLLFRESLINYDELSGTKQNMYYLVNTFLQPMYNRLDKQSMASSLEMRVPYLDHNVVKVAFGIPDNMKLRKGVAKAVLKKLAEQYLSYEQIYRPKEGFSIPLNDWLRNKKHLGQYVSVLHEKRTQERGFIIPEGLKNLLQDFWKGIDRFEYSIAGRVWILLNLELWIRSFIEEKRPLST